MGTPLRVLLVEDSDTAAAQLISALHRDGYAPTSTRVATAESLSLALKEQPWDVIFSACTLQHYSCTAALQMMREIGLDIPFLLICDPNEEQEAISLMHAGANDYLLRPNFTRLGPVVERELRDAVIRRKYQENEAELRLSRERYRAFIQHSNEGIYCFELDPPISTSWPVEEQIDAIFRNGYIAECNDRLAQIFGYAHAKEMIGKRLEDLQFHRSDSRFRAFLRSIIEAKYYLSEAIFYEVSRDGKPLVNANNIIGIVENGMLARVWGLQRDITEHVHTVEALRTSEEKYRRLVEDISDWVWEVDERGAYTYASPRIRQLLGYDPEEMLGKTPFDFMTPKDAQQIAEQFAQIAARHEPFYLLVNTMLAKDGHQVVVEVNGIPLFDAQGCFYGYRGINRDITERKTTQAAFQRERAFLSTTIDVLPVALMFISPTRELLFSNRVTKSYFTEHVMQRWDDAEWLTADHLLVPFEQWPVLRSLNKGETFINIEGIVRFPDGVEVPALHQSAPVIVEGELVAVVAAFQDISVLKEADEAKDRFLMYLSHELKTPLTSILGWAQAAESNTDLTPKALPIIIRNAKYQRFMLEDLLDVSDIISGKLALNRQRTDLWQLAQDTLEANQYLLQEHQLKLILDPPAEPLPVDADPRRIRQVIWNLLDNAAKFTEPGGTITVAGRHTDQSVILQMRDTGQGIAPEVLPTLFRPFRQIKRPEVTAGLGLGLALVKGIIELHGGTVSADSPGIGDGSTFTITLPAAGVG
ncbi:MAG: sensor histidine kinase [Armatimonadota bacterium]